MKRMYRNLLATLAINCLIISQAWAVVTKLQNNYRYDIEYIEINPSMAKDPHNAHYIKTVKSGEKANLTDFFNKGELSIRTKGGKLDFEDVSYIVRQIDREKNQHPNEEAIISVNAGWNPMYWGLNLSWQRR